MAIISVNPDVGFDIFDVDLNFYSRSGYESDTIKNANVSILNTVYPDYVYISAREGAFNFGLDLLGFGIIGTPSSGILGGTIQLIAESDRNTSTVFWAVSGISVSARDIYNAGLTPSNSDDLAIIVSALSGDDSITLSNMPDVMSGFSGNDSISGLGGNDILDGGRGNDTIDGGIGNDVALYTGSRSGALVSYNAGTQSLVISAGADGTDTLHRVEQVRFSDGLFSFAFSNTNGTPVVSNFNPANGWASQDQNPRHIADVNGDGFGDLVGFGFAGVLVSLGSANGNFGPTTLVVSDFGQTAGWISDNQFHRELADVNGDGRADIIGFGQAGVLVSLANANGSFAAPIFGLANFGTAQGWTSQAGFARVVGDVNGDGRADIVGFGQAGTLVALGNGDGSFQPVRTGIANFGVAQGWSNDTIFHRAVADVNGDGRDDIVGFGQGGTLVALSNGNGTFAAATFALSDFGVAQGWSSNDSFRRVLADVNGDDFADIIGFGIAGTLIAFGDRDGTFTDAGNDIANFGRNQGWSSDNIFHREVADINSDGLPDIVGFGVAGVLVGFNQGGFLI